MTKHQSAAAELAALLRNSPDLRIADLGGLNVRNAGDLGAASAAQLEQAATEHDEQAALFAWADAMQAQHPELSMLFAIPNGGQRHPAVAAQLKAEGVRAGVPDTFLAVQRGKFGGLFVELKRANRKNHATPAQQEWIARLRHYGYAAIVAYGCDEARQAIMAYLGQE
jgi:hypothetical protein